MLINFSYHYNTRNDNLKKNLTYLFFKEICTLTKQRKLNIEKQEKGKQTKNIKTGKICTHKGGYYIYFLKIVHVSNKVKLMILSFIHCLITCQNHFHTTTIKHLLKWRKGSSSFSKLQIKRCWERERAILKMDTYLSYKFTVN